MWPLFISSYPQTLKLTKQVANESYNIVWLESSVFYYNNHWWWSLNYSDNWRRKSSHRYVITECTVVGCSPGTVACCWPGVVWIGASLGYCGLLLAWHSMDWCWPGWGTLACCWPGIVWIGAGLGYCGLMLVSGTVAWCWSVILLRLDVGLS